MNTNADLHILEGFVCACRRPVIFGNRRFLNIRGRDTSPTPETRVPSLAIAPDLDTHMLLLTPLHPMQETFCDSWGIAPGKVALLRMDGE
jgi:hypothetical protein